MYDIFIGLNMYVIRKNFLYFKINILIYVYIIYINKYMYLCKYIFFLDYIHFI